LTAPERELQGPDLPLAARILPSWVETAVTTPLVELARCFSDLDGRVLAKLEMAGPGGSSRVRVAQRLLIDARMAGRLSPYQTLLVRGDQAPGMVQAGLILGHPALVVVGPDTPNEALAQFEVYGADVEVATDHDLDACIASMVRCTGGFPVDVDVDPSNYRAHRLGTGAEIVRQSRGRVNAFCAHVHSGGTFEGCAAVLEELDPRIRSHTVRLAGTPGPLPGQIDPRRVARAFDIEAKAAQAQVQRMARKEGILIGLEAGAVLAAARSLLEGPLPGSTIAVVLDGDSQVPGLRAKQTADDAASDSLADAA
tara:strand:+ start:3503 stop:4435 length:933 start_codon:yes stop_codon:yes gene_type:complete